MDLKVADQMFDLKRGDTWVRSPHQPIWIANPAYQIRTDILEWLFANKIEHTISNAGLHGVVFIKNRRQAALFKLTWM